MTRPRVTYALALATLLAVVTPVSAFAQRPRKLPVFAADIRGFYSGLGQDPVTAQDLDIEVGALPKRALGGMADVNFYVLRKTKLALGLYGEAILARGRAQAKDPTTGDPIGQPVQQRLRGLSGGLSLNFGHRDGWSYVSAGMGPLSFGSYVGETPPVDPAPVRYTINLGAGAKWFTASHLAFEFDIRFYQTTPVETTPPYPARQRKQLLILSAGVGFR